jgi:peptide/nickel transport system permease protein
VIESTAPIVASPRGTRWRRGAVLPALVLVVLYVTAAAAPWVALYPPNTQHRDAPNAPPMPLRVNPPGRWSESLLYVHPQTLVDSLRRRYAIDESRRIPLHFGARGHLLAPRDPEERVFLVGSDALGRDLFSRLVYGSRVSLSVGLIGVFLSTLFGMAIGVIASEVTLFPEPDSPTSPSVAPRATESETPSTARTTPRGVSNSTTRSRTSRRGAPSGRLPAAARDDPAAASDAVPVAAPPAMVSPAETFLIIVALMSFIRWAGFARVVRGIVASIRELEFVQAARALGAGSTRIILRHILPTTLPSVVVQATLGMAGAIIAEAALSFLGLGVQPPTPSWGTMLDAGRSHLFDAPHLTIFPGLAIAILVLGFNFLGDGLRDRLDPRGTR